MTYENTKIRKLFLFLSGLAVMALAPAVVFGQNAAPSSTPVTIGGFEVTSSAEFGVRGVSLSGNGNKYRSDFNYRPGVRLFDSSFRLENKDGKDKYIDSIQFNSTGWDSDPSGYTRMSVEKSGLYTFDAKIRQVQYFNYLDNNARAGHNANSRQRLGDFDLTLYPKSDLFRVRLGGSFNSLSGTNTTTTRAYSDEFIIPSTLKQKSTDFHAGVDTQLLGFNVNLSYGYRRFRDRTTWTITAPYAGFNTTNTSAMATFLRYVPTVGSTNFYTFSTNRTFAKKLDVTARAIYSSTVRNLTFNEQITGRDASNNFVDLDNFLITATTKRPQTRADLGITYRVTDKLRFSNTFTFDQFNIGGGNAFAESVASRTAAGVARATTFTNTSYYRATGWRRLSDTVEADYQFTNSFSANLGYRWGQRRIKLLGYNQPLAPATNLTRTLIDEEEENTTKTIIGGFKVKPVKGWTVWGDFQKGDADNAFTRLSNYKFTNLRVRSRWNYKDYAINLSGISKQNENPSTSTAPPANYPSGDFIANSHTRVFSAFVDGAPATAFSFSVGYTYNRQIAETDVVINTGTKLERGISRYYVKDHYAFFNLTAQPVKRLTWFASYNYNNDKGQEGINTILPILTSSYPMKLRLAETRLAIRLSRSFEWNLGYQYIGYNETVQPLTTTGFGQDYHANLPYTSLRIYFGGGEK